MLRHFNCSLLAETLKGIRTVKAVVVQGYFERKKKAGGITQ